MQSLICQLLAISVLFMSTEGLWDMAKETHPHSDIYAHQVDNPNHDIATDVDPLSDDCADHCQNLCHGHLSSIATNGTEELLVASNTFYALTSSHLSGLSQAPPTPPPHA
jgi:hypothetical protein